MQATNCFRSWQKSSSEIDPAKLCSSYVRRKKKPILLVSGYKKHRSPNRKWIFLIIFKAKWTLLSKYRRCKIFQTKIQIITISQQFRKHSSFIRILRFKKVIFFWMKVLRNSFCLQISVNLFFISNKWKDRIQIQKMTVNWFKEVILKTHKFHLDIKKIDQRQLRTIVKNRFPKFKSMI